MAIEGWIIILLRLGTEGAVKNPDALAIYNHSINQQNEIRGTQKKKKKNPSVNIYWKWNIFSLDNEIEEWNKRNNI